MDRDLVARAQRGDEAAFTELVERVGDRMYAVAHHVLRDTARADDAVQQALIDVWRKLPTLKDPDRFLAWAYRIVIRAAYAEASERRRWSLRVVVDPVMPTAVPDIAAMLADRDELDRALDRLGLDHRAVVVLKHYARLSNPEIAEVLGVAEGTVRSRLHYALQALRASLDADRRPGAAVADP